nr:myb/SANT-like domain-containing protein [Tanacetum cinerariifolium]
MKRDYNLWKSLKNGETGLGWNASAQKLDCADEWWKMKIKEVHNENAEDEDVESDDDLNDTQKDTQVGNFEMEELQNTQPSFF